MEIFANTTFYLFVIIAAVSVLTVIFAKNTKVYLPACIITLACISGLYILLKSPVMFLIHSVFFTLGGGAILTLGAKDFANEDKSTFNLNLKTFFSILLFTVFVLLTAPFFISQINAQTISTFCIEQNLPCYVPAVNLGLIIFSILIIALLSGFYTIAFWRKKWQIKWYMRFFYFFAQEFL